MTAAMFNAVATALSGLGGSTGTMTKTSVTKDVDIVYGSYFTGLENYANGLKYKTSQCDNCNVACNVQCNTCLTCNDTNCGSCNLGCQADAMTSCCSSCDNCECSAEGGQTSEPCIGAEEAPV
jgi:hypothetical protein